MKGPIYIVLLVVGGTITGCATDSDRTTNAVITPAKSPVDRNSETIVPDIPKDSWEPVFFEGIDKVAIEAGIGKLRDLSVSDTDIEVRVWGGFGLTGIEGFVLKRIGDRWSAVYVRSQTREPYDGEKNVQLKEPAAGWESAWASLIDRKILSLPDDSELNCGLGPEDGYSYVVEVKKGQNYRTYQYDDPSYKKRSGIACREVDEILGISEIISNEYGASGFGYDIQ